VDVRVDDLAGGADGGFVELVVTGDAEQREADADFVFENLCLGRRLPLFRRRE
jgi:hypothetical protein